MPLFRNANVTNPKQRLDPFNERLFPYYAGYSTTFVERLLESLMIENDSVVFDPWNGSGTTVLVATRMGLKSIGIDLNPVMVIVAKASFVSATEVNSLVPIAQSLIERSQARNKKGLADDPLSKWLFPESTGIIRQLEFEINQTLVSRDCYAPLTSKTELDRLAPLGAFFYLALFRTGRCLLKDFVPTNPTWVKFPQCPQLRKRPSSSMIYRTFIGEVRNLVRCLAGSNYLDSEEKRGSFIIRLDNAERLSLPDASVNFVVTSPPYCTRIDYAVATAIELAILRFSTSLFDQLRRSLMGTSTVKADAGLASSLLGTTCSRFLDAVYNHPSKASRTYYFKNHLQYFESLQLAIQELVRVLTLNGLCVLVVQDSYYKDIHNDVPTIITEMASHSGMILRRRQDFIANRSMVGVNNRAKQYCCARKIVESVLCFERT
ncbi:MAG: DNA methyltransferase [Methylococcales bacterium]